MIRLYEFDEWENYNLRSFTALEQQLLSIWQTRKKAEDAQEVLENEQEEIAQKEDFQPFLDFHFKKGIRARNWVGFIQTDRELIQIFPKVFKSGKWDNNVMLQHIFFWMNYVARWRLPHCKANLDTNEIDSFPELMIYIFGSFFKEILEEKPLSLYQMEEATMQMPRGSINFPRYISRSLSTGQWHNLECDHEPFMYDNALNRIIKYCTRLLAQQTQLDINKSLLNDVLFLLDEVEDIPCTIKDVETVKLNPFFEEYREALNHCRTIIGQQMYSSFSYDNDQWTMLFPMELLFESFITGFIEEHFSKEWLVQPQKSEMHLVNNPEGFRMKHDIYLEQKSDSRCKIIIDTKYKLRDSSGVAQTDLYQMVAYAVKRDCRNMILMYPCALERLKAHKIEHFTINIPNDNAKNPVKIYIMDVPFFSKEFQPEKLTTALKTCVHAMLIAIKNSSTMEQIK